MPLTHAAGDAVARKPELGAGRRSAQVGRVFYGIELKPMTNPHHEIPRFVNVAAGIAAIGGLLGFGAWLFAYLFVPETKGKSLEEIQATWAHR